jgi:hypothetical protein
MQNDGSGQITLPAPIKMSYGTSSGTLPSINDGQVGFTTQVNITQEITIPIRSAFTITTIAEITLNPGVYIITGQLSGQPTGAPPGGGNMFYNICFSETNNNLTAGYPAKAFTNFLLSFGNSHCYFRDTITHTVTVATRKTLYFNISILSVSDLKIVTGNVISATRIA